MLTTSDFNKSLGDSRRVGKRAIKLIPKEPVPGLDNLEILVFETGWTQQDGRKGICHCVVVQRFRPYKWKAKMSAWLVDDGGGFA